MIKIIMSSQGYALGNPVTDPHLEENSYVKFANRMALISDELYKVTLFLFEYY